MIDYNFMATINSHIEQNKLSELEAIQRKKDAKIILTLFVIAMVLVGLCETPH